MGAGHGCRIQSHSTPAKTWSSVPRLVIIIIAVLQLNYNNTNIHACMLWLIMMTMVITVGLTEGLQ